MHLGLICPELTGHLNPMTTLGRELVRRGCRVTVAALPGVAPRVERAGLGLTRLGTEAEQAQIMRGWEELGRLRGLKALRHAAGVSRASARVLARDLPGAIEREGIEALIVDQFSPAAALVAQELGLPFALACNALASHHSDDLPPVPLDWRYRPGAVWRWRNRLTVGAMRWVYDRSERESGPAGVSPLKFVFDTRGGVVQVAQQPAFFDFPRTDLPGHFHYTAPWHEPARDDAVDFPWDWLDGRPLVYASLGTLQNKLGWVYRAIAQAAAPLEAQVVLSLGGGGDPRTIDAPANVKVVAYAPQLRLLERAAAAVTHAGLNTALECLARGVPMLCLPITSDQPGVARRVEHLGAGEVVTLSRVSVPRLRAALGRVLRGEEARRGARLCADRLRGLHGPALAADVLLTAFGASASRTTPSERSPVPVLAP